MIENVHYPLTIFLQIPHKGMRLCPNVLFCAWQHARMDILLQHIVQIFIRVEVWGIRGDIKHLNGSPVFSQPFLHQFSVMNLEVVHDEEHLPPRVLHETPHEANEPLLRKTAEELMAAAKAEGYEMTKDEADAYMAKIHDLELDDATLTKAAGGGCYSKCALEGPM